MCRKLICRAPGTTPCGKERQHDWAEEEARLWCSHSTALAEAGGPFRAVQSWGAEAELFFLSSKA